jgi:serine/threonine protein kinase
MRHIREILNGSRLGGEHATLRAVEGPTRFGKYQLVERLASGGMAEVFRAKALGAAGFEKDIAIKRILPQFSADEAFVKMFIDEARLAAQLQHRNIVQIFDFDQVDGSYYIAMELVEGCDLKRLARRSERLPVSVALYVVSEALKGLGYAHQREIDGKPLQLVHRDVSPHNILLSRSGEVKISDFGIAKAQARATATGSGIIKGKLSYMSPEQARGEKIDLRSDLFAAGVVLHELLSGVRLFEGDSEMEIIAKVQRCQVTAPGVSQPVDTVTLKLLAREPAARFASAAEAVRAMASCPGFTDESDTLAQLVQRVMAEAPPRPAAKVAYAPTMPSDRDVPAGATRTRTDSPGAQSRSVQPVSFVSTPDAEAPRRGRWLVAAGLVVGLAGLGALVGLRTAPKPVEPTPAPPPPVAVKPAPPPDAAVEVARIVEQPAPPAPEPAPPPTRTPPKNKHTTKHTPTNPVAPVKEPAPESPAPAPAGKGTLSVTVKPWAVVVIDQGAPHQTPLHDIELPAGKHIAVLKNNDRTETVPFNISPNKAFEIRRDWTKESP